jgi:hypothetical protein
MVPIHFKTVERARVGGRIVDVNCEQCGGRYYYKLTRIGTGAGSVPYGMSTSWAAQRAEAEAVVNLQKRLAREAELVPCPKCNWISSELVKGYRLGRYRIAGELALAIALGGAFSSLVAAWHISIGNPRDPWLPYLWFDGPAASLALAVTVLLIRRWLRSRIRPNRDYPREPELPLGTPPALVMDESTWNLRRVTRPAASAGPFLDYLCGHADLPPLCCACLQPAMKDGGYSVRATRLVRIAIPRCADCYRKSGREWRRISLIFTVLGLLTGAAMVFLMARASVAWWIIIFSSLGLLIATAALIVVVATARTAPVRVCRRDRSRGVVRLRFRNGDYAEAVSRRLNEISSAQ